MRNNITDPLNWLHDVASCIQCVANPQGDLHDQRNRVDQQRDSQVQSKSTRYRKIYPNEESAQRLLRLCLG